MNKIGLLFALIFMVYSSILLAQDGDDGTNFLGTVIQNQIDPEGNVPEIEELIDEDFLLDDGQLYDDFPKVSVRILDKITADTKTFDLEIGKTVAYGNLRIRPTTCKKAPPIDEPESASFLQIWEKIHEGSDQWIFSGWMFASSPSLSGMEHPVYDVWVIDCKS